MLRWNESDLLECLGVEPFLEDDDQSYEFNIKGDSIDLQVKILPQNDVVGIKTISKRTGENYTSNYYIVLGSISYNSEDEVLVFTDCIPIDDEFYHSHFDRSDIPNSYRFRVELGIKPEIFVRTVLV